MRSVSGSDVGDGSASGVPVLADGAGASPEPEQPTTRLRIAAARSPAFLSCMDRSLHHLWRDEGRMLSPEPRIVRAPSEVTRATAWAATRNRHATGGSSSPDVGTTL